jgi:hypothetical protein
MSANRWRRALAVGGWPALASKYGEATMAKPTPPVSPITGNSPELITEIPQL